MEIALAICVAVLAGLVVYIVQDMKSQLKDFRDHMERQLREINQKLQANATSVAVLQAMKDRRED